MKSEKKFIRMKNSIEWKKEGSFYLFMYMDIWRISLSNKGEKIKFWLSNIFFSLFTIILRMYQFSSPSNTFLIYIGGEELSASSCLNHF